MTLQGIGHRLRRLERRHPAGQGARVAFVLVRNEDDRAAPLPPAQTVYVMDLAGW